MTEHTSEQASDSEARAAQRAEASSASGRSGALLGLQRTAGNSAVVLAIQRHEDADPSLVKQVAADPVLRDPSQGPQESIFGDAARRLKGAVSSLFGGGGGAAAGAAAGAGTATGADVGTAGVGGGTAAVTALAPGLPSAPAVPPVAAPGTAPTTALGTPGTTAAAGGTATAAKTETPVPVLAGTLNVAISQAALQAAFGSTAGRTIIQGQITTVKGHAAVCTAYDNWMIAHDMDHPTAGRKWKAGDKLAINTAQGMQTNAFAEPPPSTKIVIDESSTDPTATMHEMLHVNASPDFRAGKVSRVINEGVTQRLAKKACVAAGRSTAGSENTYTQEQEIVEKIVGLVTEAKVMSAYFGGPDPLITELDAKIGVGRFATIKAFLDVDNYAAAKPLLVAAPATPAPAPAAAPAATAAPPTPAPPTAGAPAS